MAASPPTSTRGGRPGRSHLLALVALCLLAGAVGCSDPAASPGARRASGTASTTTTTTSPASLPAPCQEAAKQPPPRDRVRYSVLGQTGNEWELGAEPRSTVTVREEVTPDAHLPTLTFEVQLDSAPTSQPSHVLDVQHDVPPGVHDSTVRWDGRDLHGRALPAGRYRLFATTRPVGDVMVLCTNGSHTTLHDVSLGEQSSGLGVLVVP